MHLASQSTLDLCSSLYSPPPMTTKHTTARAHAGTAGFLSSPFLSAYDLRGFVRPCLAASALRAFFREILLAPPPLPLPPLLEDERGWDDYSKGAVVVNG